MEIPKSDLLILRNILHGESISSTVVVKVLQELDQRLNLTMPSHKRFIHDQEYYEHRAKHFVSEKEEHIGSNKD